MRYARDYIKSHMLSEPSLVVGLQYNLKRRRCDDYFGTLIKINKTCVLSLQKNECENKNIK